MPGSSLNRGADGGRTDFFPPFPEWVDTVAVNASTNSPILVPDWAKYAVFAFEPGANVAVRAEQAAVYPTALITNGSGSLINPSQFDVTEVGTLNFIAKSAATVVSLAWYR